MHSNAFAFTKINALCETALFPADNLLEHYRNFKEKEIYMMLLSFNWFSSRKIMSNSVSSEETPYRK